MMNMDMNKVKEQHNMVDIQVDFLVVDFILMGMKFHLKIYLICFLMEEWEEEEFFILILVVQDLELINSILMVDNKEDKDNSKKENKEILIYYKKYFNFYLF
eukprot:TRINITY_DN64992_c5_g2_i1.p2 TRINITY_DN64992_c5_g2~~TRINITY_DN64992_c5_g2_i1.p2  ORF type:complete len:102 (+),score=12.93 TRINITY_DN64992_c5_g2_i1:321-626(+)